MDESDATAEEIHQALRELNIINRWLGGEQISTSGIARLLNGYHRPYRIIDFGCGGGGTLQAIHRWSRDRQIEVELTGLDIRPEAIRHSERVLGHMHNLELLQGDFRRFQPEDNAYDIAHCSLFMHHFYEEDLYHLIEKMYRSASLGIIINDLHRHGLAERCIRLLTRLFSNSRLVKNDAPLSVRKGFLRPELEAIFDKLHLTDYTIQWRWAFRYLVVVNKNSKLQNSNAVNDPHNREPHPAVIPLENDSDDQA